MKINKPVRLAILLFVLAIIISSKVIIYPIYLATSHVATAPIPQEFSDQYHPNDVILNDISTQHSNMDAFYKISQLPLTKMHVFEPVLPPESHDLRVLIVCGQHGRELVSSELCYNLISLMQGKINQFDRTKAIYQLKAWGVAFYIVPIVNPYARALTFTRKQCVRVNENGVDLNRNFPSNFQKPSNKKNYVQGDEEYEGISPLSESESIDLDMYIDIIQPHMFINVHSGGNAVLIPYDADITQQYKNYRTVVHAVNSVRATSRMRMDFTLGPSSLLYYQSYGTMMDYVIDFKHVDIALTLEIFDNATISSAQSEASVKDCIDFFNPQEGIELSRTIDKWIYFILLFTKKIYKHIIF